MGQSTAARACILCGAQRGTVILDFEVKTSPNKTMTISRSSSSTKSSFRTPKWKIKSKEPYKIGEKKGCASTFQLPDAPTTTFQSCLDSPILSTKQDSFSH